MVMMRNFVFKIIKNGIQKFYTIPNRLAVVLAVVCVMRERLTIVLRNPLYPVENFLDAFY